MPHITVEYSANLNSDLAIQGLVDSLHKAALETGVFPIGGLRTRAERRDVYAIADRAPDNAFIAVVARIGAGRDADTRRRVAEGLLRTVEAVTRDIFAHRGLSITVEVQEIDPTASLKLNNLHERVRHKAAAQ